MNRNTSKPHKEKTKQQKTMKNPQGAEITKMNDKELSKQIKDLGAQIIDLLSKKNVQNIIAIRTLTEIISFFIINQFSCEKDREAMLEFTIELLHLGLEEHAKHSTR